MLRLTSIRLLTVAVAFAGICALGLSNAEAGVPTFGPRLVLPVDGHVHPKLRLGFHGHVDFGEGMHVDHVLRFSHASRIGLERGDLILQVNGRRIVSEHDYHQGLAKTGRYLRLLVHDVHGRGDAFITYDVHRERVVGHHFVTHH